MKRIAKFAAALVVCGIPLTLLTAFIWVYLKPGQAIAWWTGHGVNWPRWARFGEAMVALGRRIDAFADRIVA